MFYKLSLRNARRSFRDYAVYFLTLTLGICIFYVFNSIETQSLMMDISASQYEILKSLTRIMGYVSVFVSIILGFLILYANGFLIRRRKRELGIYRILGMDKGKISTLLVLETLAIGVVSLGIGLVLGIFMSQLLAVITAQLFEVRLKAFTFVFSPEAFGKSILYFGLIYLLVMAANVWTIGRYKLIDLVNAHRQNQELRLRSLPLCVVLFLLSLACLAAAYVLILRNGLLYLGWPFTLCILLGSLGTLLFFLSLSGFLLRVVQANRRLYLTGLHMFVLRQLNHKINANFVSMTMVCLMLLMAIGCLVSGVSINQVMSADLQALAPYDVTLICHSQDVLEEENHTLAQALQERGLALEDYASAYTELRLYSTGLAIEQLLTAEGQAAPPVSGELDAVSLSDYNALRAMHGLEPLSLPENTYALSSNDGRLRDTLEGMLAAETPVRLYGRTLSVGPCREVLTLALFDSGNAENVCTLVLPDATLEALPVEEFYCRTLANVQLLQDDEAYEQAFLDAFYAIVRQEEDHQENPLYMSQNTGRDIRNANAGVKVTGSYLTIYLGVIFLITCAAVLALQQLSEAADNTARYAILRRMGAEEGMIRRALFTQIALYFLLPLALAAVHSVVGVTVVADVVRSLGDLHIGQNVLVAAVILAVIYGAYFLATYGASLAMLRPRQQR